MPQVRAKAIGYDGLRLRSEGEVFEFSGAPAPWFEYLDPKDEAAAKDAHMSDEGKRIRAEVEARCRAEIEAQVRAETEARFRAEIEAEVRAETKAKLDAAGHKDASDLV